MVGMISESKLPAVGASLLYFVTWQHRDFIGVDNAGLDALLLRREGPDRVQKSAGKDFRGTNSLKICVVTSHGLR